MGKSVLDVVWRVIETESARAQSALPDRELLRRFAVANDQRAFAALFHRHAGMVLGVCRRVLPSVQDAEDACQATFVVLARKAKGGRWQASIANWLYATARKVAANALIAARRRAQREGRGAVAEPVHPLDQITSQELLTALDEELDRLPPRYREPLVLCYLQGLTRDEAAHRLSVPVGTLKIRLERGRKRLADGLTRRGCGLGAGLLTLAVTSANQAAPLRLARGVAAALSGSPTPSVAALAEEVAVSGVLNKGAFAFGAMVGVLALGIAWAAAVVASPAEAERGTPQQTAPAAPAPASPKELARTDALGDPLPPGAVARLGTMRFQSGMWPTQIVASPDGKKLVTVGYNLSSAQHVTVWDAATGRVLRHVPLQQVAVHAATILPNGRGFAIVKVSMADYAVWEFTDEKAAPPTATRPNEMNVTGNGTFAASAVSPDGSLLAGGERAGDAGNEGKLNVWALVPGSHVRTLAPRWFVNAPGGFLGLAFTPDGKRLIGIVQQQAPSATGRMGQVVPGQPAAAVDVFVWDATTGKQILTFQGPGGKELRELKDFDPYETPAGLGRTLAMAPDGKTLYSLSQAGRMAAIDLRTGKERFGFTAFAPSSDRPFSIDGLAITADSTLIAVQRFQAIAGFDARTGKRLWHSRDKNLHSAQSLGLLPDGKRFVIGHNGGSLFICEAATGKVLNEQPGHRSILTAVAVADMGRTALTSAGDRTICRWDLATGKQVGRRTVDSLESFHVIGFAPDGRRAVAGWHIERAGALHCAAGLVDVGTGKLIAELPLTKSYTFPRAWLPDGSLIVSQRSDRAIHFERNGRELRSFKAGEDRQVNAVAVAPDGKWLVLAGEGAQNGRFRSSRGWVGLFDVQSGAAKGIWEFPNQFSSAAFTPDGEAIVLSGTVGPPPRPVNQPPIAVAPATAVVLFDPIQGKVFTPFAAPNPQARDRFATSIAMAPTGYQFAVAEVFESDYAITVYETASGAIRRQLRGHRNLVSQLAFTPDGQRLVSASRDGTGLVWDVAPPRPEATALSEADRRRCWDALAAADDTAAYRALGKLASDPVGTVGYIKANLKPPRAPSDAEIDRLIERLDAPDFAERDAASKELHRFGTLAIARVHDRLRQIASLEVRRRLEALLQEHEWRGRLTGSRLRERRAIELLETIGTPSALAVLNAVAESCNTPLARDAAWAVKRLRARSGPHRP
jgi:RNA polymerase sigma factor (sigma-70 family)